METVRNYIFLGSKITADGDCSHEMKRPLLLRRKAMTNLDRILKSRDIADKGPSSQSYGFSSSYVCMWELDHKEGLTPKNWCFWTMVLEKTVESPLDCKEIKPVNPKGNQSWIFTGRTSSEAEAPVLWLPDVKSWLIGKDPDGGKDWGREEKGTTEDEMVGWHHQLYGHEFEWTLGDSEGQGSLMWYNPWVAKSPTRLINCTTTRLETLQKLWEETFLALPPSGRCWHPWLRATSLYRGFCFSVVLFCVLLFCFL